MIEQLAPYIDLHTHHVRSTPDTVELLSCYLAEADKLPSHDTLYYSVGLHPWRAEELREESLPLLRKALQLPRVIALGEAGLDKATKHSTLAEQLPILRAQILLSEELELPLILHLVRAQDELLRLRRELQPKHPWIIHGFRGGLDQARQLLRAGLYLSFGEHFRPESLREAYAAGQAFLETDDAPELSIQAVYQAASEALALDESTLREQLYTSAKHLFPSLL